MKKILFFFTQPLHCYHLRLMRTIAKFIQISSFGSFKWILASGGMEQAMLKITSKGQACSIRICDTSFFSHIFAFVAPVPRLQPAFRACLFPTCRSPGLLHLSSGATLDHLTLCVLLINVPLSELLLRALYLGLYSTITTGRAHFDACLTVLHSTSHTQT